jgi:hypothetical protein
MYITGWIAIVVLAVRVTTTTRFLISPMRKMPTFGCEMIAPPNRLPFRPGFDTLNVVPDEVVGGDLAGLRARVARSSMARGDAAQLS